MASDKQTYITAEGLERLKEELQNLIINKRREVAGRIASAKELGDLSENAEYSDAKDEQAFIETRIAELEDIVRNVQIIKKANGRNSSVQVGSTIEIEDEAGNIKKYSIVGSNEVDPINGKISNESPLGKAFLGHKVGEIAEVQVPKGNMKFKIAKIS
ncbi:MAG: transcription elongation factor GreA [Patescibacteria group bacterium]